MVEIRMSGQPQAPGYAQPGGLSGMNLSQLQALDSGAIGGSASGGSGMQAQWMGNHVANAMSFAAGAARGGGGAGMFGGGGGAGLTASTVAAGVVQALGTPIPNAPASSVAGNLTGMTFTLGRTGGFAFGGGAFQPPGGGGFGGGNPFTMPLPPGGWTQPPPFLARQRNQSGSPPGGGNGGGGGGTGGRRGGGGGIPFAGMIGLGATGRMLGRGLGIYAGAEIAEELAFLPQSFASAEGSALSNAAPYRNLTYGAYAQGRAGGFSGEGLRDSVYDGVKAPEWMEKLGLGPTEAMRMLSGFGVTQRSVGASTDLIKELAGTQFTPSFSGLDMQPSIGQAARYGAVSPNASGVRDYTQQMAPILETAVERGLDRASVLRSIDTAINLSAKGGGIGATPGGLGSFISQYTDLPGGRTGEAGVNVAERLQSATGSVGQNPLRTMAFVQAAQGMKTEGSLRAFLNKNQEGYFEKFSANPVGRQLINNYLEAQRSGNDYAAAMYLAQIVGGGGVEGVGSNPQAERELLTNNPLINQLPGYMRPLATGMTGITPGQYIAGQGGGAGGDLVTQAYDQLRKSGLTHEAAAATLANMTTESAGFNPYAKNMDGGGQGAHGLLQLRGSRLTNFNKQFGHMPDDPSISAQQLTKEAVEFYRREQTEQGLDRGAYQSGQDVNRAGSAEEGVDILRNEYSRPGPGVSRSYIEQQRSYARAYDKQYAGRQVGAGRVAPGEEGYIDPSQVDPSPPTRGAGSSNIPTDALRAQSDAMAGMMKGSEISFGEMNIIIPKVNEQLSNLGKAAAAAAKELMRLRNPNGIAGPDFNPFLATPN